MCVCMLTHTHTSIIHMYIDMYVHMPVEKFAQPKYKLCICVCDLRTSCDFVCVCVCTLSFSLLFIL